jgi:hypothetical protein
MEGAVASLLFVSIDMAVSAAFGCKGWDGLVGAFDLYFDTMAFWTAS